MRVPVAVLFGLFCIAGLGRLVAAQDSLILKIPSGFTKPRIPADNPISKEKVSLGRYLFYDKRLSISGRMSCATCHRQELAFTDGRAVSIGATGQAHRRSALSLVNVAYETVLTWSDAGVKTLEQQILIPLTSENPVEMGLHGRERIVLSDLQKDRLYRELFPQAFPRDAQPFTMTNVAKAIASFERTILAGDSPYDRYARHGDSGAISESAKRGELLFFNNTVAGCYRCHAGFDFSDATQKPRFHNTALYDDGAKFRAPTLRNIAVTGPYMHDGSVGTLEEVLDHYAAGGLRGSHNPGKDPLMTGFTLTRQNREDLLAFLRSLTDTQLLTDPGFSDPWAHYPENTPSWNFPIFELSADPACRSAPSLSVP